MTQKSQCSRDLIVRGGEIVNIVRDGETGNGVLVLRIIWGVRRNAYGDQFDRKNQLQLLKEMDAVRFQSEFGSKRIDSIWGYI